MRAWREVVDDVPANAARFDQNWRRGDDCALARRLVINERALKQWGEVEWHPARFVMTWMRTVRAGAVHRLRAASPVWQRARTQWRRHWRYHGMPNAAHLMAAAPRDSRAAARSAQREQRPQEQRAASDATHSGASSAAASASGARARNAQGDADPGESDMGADTADGAPADREGARPDSDTDTSETEAGRQALPQTYGYAHARATYTGA